jgi:hypothetical protein
MFSKSQCRPGLLEKVIDFVKGSHFIIILENTANDQLQSLKKGETSYRHQLVSS